YSLALLYSEAPINWASMEVPATEIPIPKDINKNNIGHTKEVAANCTEPSLLTHMASARLYRVCIKLFTIIGMDNVIMTFIIFPFNINSFLFFLSISILHLLRQGGRFSL